MSFFCFGNLPKAPLFGFSCFGDLLEAQLFGWASNYHLIIASY